MRTESPNGTPASPRLLEMLTDRFGAIEAIAMASIKLARHVPEDELSMDRLVADAVLDFGDDPRAASEAAAKWTCQAADSCVYGVFLLMKHPVWRNEWRSTLLDSSRNRGSLRRAARPSLALR